MTNTAMTSSDIDKAYNREELELTDFDTLIERAMTCSPSGLALKDSKRAITWKQLQNRVNQIANALLANGVQSGDHISLLGNNSVTYAEIMLGIQRAGACITPLPNLATPDTIIRLLDDCDCKFLFITSDYTDLVRVNEGQANFPQLIHFDSDGAAGASLNDFIGKAPPTHPDVLLTPDTGFNLIYSSGTTGLPKGILHNRAFRAREAQIMEEYYSVIDGLRSVTSTPFYSNTTLYYFFAMLAMGGTIHIMEKFDCERFLQISEEEKITNAILVPVQYERLLRHPTFDNYDLSSYQYKSSTSAPFRAEVKREILERWPAGGLVDAWGMTEGGPGTALIAHEHPDKLDTVGTTFGLTEIKVIDDEGNELPQGQIGELIGWSPNMMVGYLNRQEATKEASWYDQDGRRFHRSGDTGWIDEDGFIHLLDRKKDMIISGGFNVYATDLENCLLEHPGVQDVAVIGVPSDAWGETPLAFVVPSDKKHFNTKEILDWANTRLGKAQRISEIRAIPVLPRSAIGKILKTELRESVKKDVQS